MAEEKVTFDADVGGFLRAINKLQAAQKELGRDIKVSSLAAANGSKVAEVAYVKQSQELARLTQQHRLYKQELQSITGETVRFGGNLGKTGMMLNQVTFAMDDFASTVGTMGVAGGLRSASNNLSMLAVQIHPLAGLATVAATALAGLAFKGSDAASSVKEVSKAMEVGQEMARKFKDRIAELQDQILRSSKTNAEYAKHVDDAAHKAAKDAINVKRDELKGQIDAVPLDKLKKMQKNADDLMAGAMAGGDPAMAQAAFDEQKKVAQMRQDRAAKIREFHQLGGQLGELDRTQRARDMAVMKGTVNRGAAAVRNAVGGIGNWVMEAGGDFLAKQKEKQIEAAQKEARGLQMEERDRRLSGVKVPKDEQLAMGKRQAAVEDKIAGLTDDLKALTEELKKAGPNPFDAAIEKLMKFLDEPGFSVRPATDRNANR